MNVLELISLSKTFEDKEVLKDFTLDIKEGEFLTLLGPSGCGKTTTLRIIGGFEEADRGIVNFMGQNINDVPAYKRDLNTVFQSYALFPHLNVFENIAFGLRLKKIPEGEIKDKVLRMLKLIGLEDFSKRKITSLSGGQQQRIAIARALVNEPKVLLLDEPLGALDLKLRKGMQLELKRIQESVGITFIYVTHDQEEAMTMSDRIVVMNQGLIQQVGRPVDIYNEPKNSFVASFIGESNIIKGRIVEDYLVEFSDHVFKCVDSGFGQDIPVQVVLRPEDIIMTKEEDGMISGTVKSVIFMGVHNEIRADVKGYEYLIHSTKSAEVGQRIGLRVDPDEIHVMAWEDENEL